MQERFAIETMALKEQTASQANQIDQQDLKLSRCNSQNEQVKSINRVQRQSMRKSEEETHHLLIVVEKLKSV